MHVSWELRVRRGALGDNGVHACHQAWLGWCVRNGELSPVFSVAKQLVDGIPKLDASLFRGATEIVQSEMRVVHSSFSFARLRLRLIMYFPHNPLSSASALVRVHLFSQNTSLFRQPSAQTNRIRWKGLRRTQKSPVRWLCRRKTLTSCLCSRNASLTYTSKDICLEV